MRSIWWMTVVLCFLASALAPGKDVFAEELFQSGDTIVFFGDSITQGGNYIDFFEATLRQRYPDREFHIFNRGISSETISGTSEPDHDPRRPWAHERFTRDIVPLKPQVLFACFGMNDGNYHPFDWGRFEKYQQGIRRLLARAKDEAGVRMVILMTPPPFDPYQRKSSDPAAKSYGYKYAAVDYDDTLRRYSEWLLSLRDEGIPVVDLHSTLNEHVRTRRKNEVSFTIAPDAVHPNSTGHWLMAWQMVRQLALTQQEVTTTWAEEIPETGGTYPFPVVPGEMPIVTVGVSDPQIDQKSVTEETRNGTGMTLVLRWSRAQPGRKYEVRIVQAIHGEYGGAILKEGLRIPTATSHVPASRGPWLDLIRERRTLEYWQFRSQTDKPLGGKTPHDNIPERLRELEREIVDGIHASTMKITVTPVP